MTSQGAPIAVNNNLLLCLKYGYRGENGNRVADKGVPQPQSTTEIWLDQLMECQFSQGNTMLLLRVPECQQALDLAIILDSSGSITDTGAENWNITKNFVANLTRRFNVGQGSSQVRVSGEAVFTEDRGTISNILYPKWPRNHNNPHGYGAGHFAYSRMHLAWTTHIFRIKL